MNLKSRLSAHSARGISYFLIGLRMSVPKAKTGHKLSRNYYAVKNTQKRSSRDFHIALPEAILLECISKLGSTPAVIFDISFPLVVLLNATVLISLE